MWKVNINDVPTEHREWSWESGNYDRYRQNISVALGNSEEARHPFDVELTRVPPGQKPCPVHEHSHWTEFFIVVSGTGEVTRNDEKARVGSGDCFIQPAGTRHRIANASETEDLVYYVIANEHPNDSVIRHEV